MRLDHSFIPAIFTPAVDMRAAPTVAGLAALAALAPGALVSHAASPHAQFEAGVPLEEIKCGEGLVLLESPRGRPACVTEGSAGRLVQRGFEEVVPVVTDRDVVVPGAMPNMVSGNDTGVESANDEPSDASPVDIMEIMEKMRGSEPLILFGYKKSVTDQAEQLDLIPDERYEYVFKMPPEDPDAFAEKIMTVMDDRIIKKTHTMSSGFWYEYTTERGQVIMESIGDIPTVTYVVNEVHSDDVDTFISRVLDGFGIDADEDEIDYSPYWVLGLGIKHPLVEVHQKWENGLEVHRHYVDFEFESTRTEVFFGDWISDFDKFELYPFNLATLTAHEYLVNSEELKKEDCNYLSNVAYVSGKIDIFNGRPVYEMDVGTCTVPYKTEMFRSGPSDFYYGFVVYVDAVTGVPLFAGKEESNGTWNWLNTKGLVS
ncbi:exported hypothetical protein [Nitrosopumilaceae archaeon]|nr:exported hypothetical protein [Nitrosopumilaceae archaeon]